MQSPIRSSLFASLAVGLCAAGAAAQSTTRESVDSSGAEANGASSVTGISADGNVVGFQSDATNLVANDTNNRSDAFVRNRTTGVVTRVSVRSNGNEGQGPSYGAAPNGDGSIVAFYSDAKNLVNGDTNGTTDVFVFDMATAKTTRVSVDSAGVEANGASTTPTISTDGNIVAFQSSATNLIASDTNGVSDIFVKDRSTGITERVSVDSNGVEANANSFSARMSADGRYIFFYSDATNLVANDTNGFTDAFLHDRVTGITELVTVDSNGAQGNNTSLNGTVSADGRYVAFLSYATNFVSGDTNAGSDVFVHDRQTGATTLVSCDSSGVIGDKASFTARITADGRYCDFASSATNLVAGDTNGVDDIFRKDLVTGVTTRLSVDSTGTESNNTSALLWNSADGHFTAFGSTASNLVANDTNGVNDVFMRVDCSPASWFNYGAGWPGTLGTPTMTSSANPVFGATITINITNSVPATTPGLIIIGLGEANIPTSKDGTLLVVPLLFIPISLPVGGIGLNGTMPTDTSLCGLEIDLQTLEIDGNASKGLSFTDGLALVLGN